MKDEHLNQYVHGVAPCPLSVQCLRMLDALDLCDATRRGRDIAEEQEYALLSVEEAQQVEKLCAHLPTCLACTLTLARARRMRVRQRKAMHGWLAEEGMQVPSTVSRILAATTREPVPAARSSAEMSPVAFTPLPPSLPAPARRSRISRAWGMLLTSAAVFTLVLGSVLFFVQMELQRQANTSGTVATPLNRQPAFPSPTSLPSPSPAVPLRDWHSVLLVSSSLTLGTMLLNVDTRSGKSKNLISQPIASDAVVDGVSHDGSNVLYHAVNADSQTTSYWTLNAFGTQGYFYKVDRGQGGNAVWMPDSRYVLIAVNTGGVLKVDTHTGASVTLLPEIKMSKLEFYRYPYLYFLGAGDQETSALYRINMINGTTPQLVTSQSPDSTFWLSPDGQTVYYANQEAAGRPGIYAASSDGKSSRYISSAGAPIGYAEDDTLMLMRQQGSAFQVVRYTPPEAVVIHDVAPGAVSLCDTTAASQQSICDHSIALAPLGGALVVEAGYGDGSHKVLSIDVKTGKSSSLPITISKDTHVQLIGWNGMAA